MCDSRTTSAPRTSSNRASSASHGDVDCAGDLEDRAVVLAEPDRAVAVDHRARQVALLVLDDGELADAVLERRVGRQPLAEPVLHLLARSGRRRASKTCVDEGVAADRADRGEQTRREPVVVRRERVLGVGRDVVQVARPADAVADGPAVDEARTPRARGAAGGRRSGSRRGAWRAGRARLRRRGGARTRMSRRSDDGRRPGACRSRRPTRQRRPVTVGRLRR